MHSRHLSLIYCPSFFGCIWPRCQCTLANHYVALLRLIPLLRLFAHPMLPLLSFRYLYKHSLYSVIVGCAMYK
ncbi:hypothetical protein BDZ89DRAFT_230873 [Hymenopellis radicata]|nr:hypothetical protein BDZ89DRAFT_230873 [Hymenopellis radicata]